VARPIKELRGFERITLRPNETRTVRLQLKGSDLTYWDAAKRSFVVEPGRLSIMLGASSADTRIEKTIFGDAVTMSSPEYGRATYRKVTWRLMPFLFVCYVFAYVDRVNVGFAKLQMQRDLSMSDAVYGVGAGIFFLGYFIF